MTFQEFIHLKAVNRNNCKFSKYSMWLVITLLELKEEREEGGGEGEGQKQMGEREWKKSEREWKDFPPTSVQIGDFVGNIS